MRGIVSKIGLKIVISEVYDQGTEIAGLRFYELAEDWNKNVDQIPKLLGKNLHYELIKINNKTFARFL